MGQQVGRVGEPGAGLQHQPPPQHQQQPRGLRGSSAARPAGRRREAAGRTAEGGGFNIFTQHGEGPGRAGGAGAGEGGGGLPPALVPCQRVGWGGSGKGTRSPFLPPSLFCCCRFHWGRGELGELAGRRRGASRRRGEPGSPCRRRVPRDARLGPARSLAARSGPEKLPPELGTGRDCPPSTAEARWHRRESKLAVLGSCQGGGS